MPLTASILLATFLQGAVSAAAPALPALDLDLVPPAAREALGSAYRNAESRPADPDAAGAFARALHAWEQWASAHAAYARAQTLAPAGFDWHYLDAVVLQRLARHAEAAGRLQSALALRPGYAPANARLIEALFEAGKLEESERLARLLIADRRLEPVGRFFLGRIAAVNGSHEVAVEHLQRAIELFPQWGAAHYALAISYRTLGRRDDAQQALTRHAEYGPRWPGLDDPVLDAVAALRDDAGALLNRALQLADRDDVAGAIAALEAALSQDPGLAQAHANLISLYGRLGEHGKAEGHYRALLALGADVGDAHYDYGVLLGLQGRWQEAEAAYRKAAGVNPLHASAHNNLGETLERQGRTEEALAAYRKAVEIQPPFRLARFNAGRMLLVLNRPDEAVVELETLSTGRDAEAPRYLAALAIATLRAGRRGEAVKWALEAHRLALEHGQTDFAAALARDLGLTK